MSYCLSHPEALAVRYSKHFAAFRKKNIYNVCPECLNILSRFQVCHRLSPYLFCQKKEKGLCNSFLFKYTPMALSLFKVVCTFSHSQLNKLLNKVNTQ
jgi:hypothetical protein